jgi:HSP90 family molecular chaperone
LTDEHTPLLFFKRKYFFPAGKKFQNVAKEGLSLDGDSEAAKAAKKEQTERFEPLLKWLGEEALKEHILRAELSERLSSSPCALITSRSGLDCPILCLGCVYACIGA